MTVSELEVMADLLDRCCAEHRVRRGEKGPIPDLFGDLAILLRDRGEVVPAMLAIHCAAALRLGQGEDMLGLFFYGLGDIDLTGEGGGEP